MIDDWDPEPAELRDGEDTDLSAHARGNLEQLIEGARSGDVDFKDVEAYRQAALKRERGGGGE
jgi:hypothetical protein